MGPLKSGQYKVYKSTGAAQFSILNPRRNEKGYVEKDGAILVEACPCDGKDENGNINPLWSQKISFAINMTDLASLMDRSNPKAGRLYHNFKGASKTLEFIPGQGKYEGTYMMRIQISDNGDRRQATVPLTNGEYNMIHRLLVGAAPKLIAWE